MLVEKGLVFNTQFGSTTPDLPTLLARTSARHSKLCPRQVLGVRMGLFGLELLELPNFNQSRRLLVILETDGCFADGIEVDGVKIPRSIDGITSDNG